MTAFEIYKKTFRFTLMRILCGVAGVVLIAGLPALTFAFTGKATDEVRIAVCAGAFLLACIIAGLLSHFLGYVFRAGQIAMAAKGISEGELPEDVYGEGKAAVKKRFGTVAVFFAIERIINGIVRQITNGLNRLANALGGSSRGRNNESNPLQIIVAIINLIISAMLKFLCACIMGWVFIHPGQNAWRSACDGALVYFKNWKDLLKNTAKVIGLGLLSLIIIGGLLFGICHLVLDNASFANTMAVELEDFLQHDFLDENGNPEIDLTAKELLIIAEAVIALILWGIINSALVDPYVMISVMSRYIKAGLANAPAREMDSKLAGMSKSYKKAIAAAAE
ncbi:MAG: hypothetical protein CW338_03950 [Clostridiales bacterium]|nr:hypothetical protein [Clostridiales bacterium]